MAVIETKIPIVALQTKYPQSSSICSRICSSACRDFNDVPVRAIPLYNSSDSYDGISDSIIQQQMPIQLRDVMTSDAYHEFCMKINDLIRQYDEADKYRKKYAETNVILVTLIASLMSASAYSLGAQYVLPPDKDDEDAIDVLYLVLYLFFGMFALYIFVFAVISLYIRIYNGEIVKYISVQKNVYETIHRECEILSKDISTPLLVVTLYLGYSMDDNNGNKYKRHFDRTSQAWIKAIIFDHIIVTSTNIV